MPEPWATARLTMDASLARATWWREHLLDVERQLGLAALAVGVPGILLGVPGSPWLALLGALPWGALVVQHVAGRHRVARGPMDLAFSDLGLRIERPWVVWEVGWALLQVRRVPGGLLVKLPNGERAYVPRRALRPADAGPRILSRARPPYADGADRHQVTHRPPTFDPVYRMALVMLVGPRTVTCADLLRAACAVPSTFDRLVAAGVTADAWGDDGPVRPPLGAPDLVNPFQVPETAADPGGDVAMVVRGAMGRDAGAVVRPEAVLEELWQVESVRPRMRAAGWPRPLPAVGPAPRPSSGVVVRNDDRTPMEAVAGALERHCGLTRTAAVRATLRVHLAGEAVVAAEDPAGAVARIAAEAAAAGHPLRVEADPG